MQEMEVPLKLAILVCSGCGALEGHWIVRMICPPTVTRRFILWFIYGSFGPFDFFMTFFLIRVSNRKGFF